MQHGALGYPLSHVKLQNASRQVSGSQPLGGGEQWRAATVKMYLSVTLSKIINEICLTISLKDPVICTQVGKSCHDLSIGSAKVRHRSRSVVEKEADAQVTGMERLRYLTVTRLLQIVHQES